MAKRKAEGPGASGDESAAPQRELTWREERFIQEYLRTSNATVSAAEAGYGAPRQTGSRLLSRAYISDAIELQREKDRALLNFNREEALKILVGMALATVDDFSDVLKDPTEKENYIGLGYKKHAIVSADQSRKFGNSVKLANKQAVVNDLWEKLGLGKESSGRDRTAFLREILGLAGSLDKKGGSG